MDGDESPLFENGFEISLMVGMFCKIKTERDCFIFLSLSLHYDNTNSERLDNSNEKNDFQWVEEIYYIEYDNIMSMDLIHILFLISS